MHRARSRGAIGYAGTRCCGGGGILSLSLSFLLPCSSSLGLSITVLLLSLSLSRHGRLVRREWQCMFFQLDFSRDIEFPYVDIDVT